MNLETRINVMSRLRTMSEVSAAKYDGPGRRYLRLCEEVNVVHGPLECDVSEDTMILVDIYAAQ